MNPSPCPFGLSLSKLARDMRHFDKLSANGFSGSKPNGKATR